MEKTNNINKSISSAEKITRKQALKRAGVSALTATSLLFLSTRAHATGSKSVTPKSQPTTPGRA